MRKLTFSILLSLAACGGSSTTTSTSKSCSTEHMCQNGDCMCTLDGPNKGNTCCNPSDDKCKDSATNCTKYCEVCK